MEENYQTIDESIQSTSGLEISPRAVVFLRETRKWAKFLAVLIFILLGLMFFVAMISFFGVNSFSSLYGDSAMGIFGSIGMFFLIVIMGVVYYFPAYYLLQFSNKMKKALEGNDNVFLDEAFKYLKSHYKFVGIMLIVVMGFYLISIVIMMFTAFSTF